ncbi:murein L,D-transpeptidase family protein [Litorimonas sp. RW-G-Af-16]|uniref:L,D-transpeptidase family protein n=1 Tax=Litorimonas sp. RW-G-Af-16 TaxID=3241168 RepID=UPI00390CC386
MRYLITICLAVMALLTFGCSDAASSTRSEKAIATWTPKLQKSLAAKDLTLGSPIFLRITKTQSVDDQRGYLEAFVQNTAGKYVPFKRWEVCYYSGALGPKLKQGDGQSPEGFYFVTPARMNPNSSYHLSFNLGYPNAFDRAHGRTGDFLMVHGKCVSIGCYAMTDAGVEEIYTLVDAAHAGGQSVVRVHAFPFPMTDANLDAFADNPNAAFWENLQEGWDWFETRKRPPNVTVTDKHYVFGELPQ